MRTLMLSILALVPSTARAAEEDVQLWTVVTASGSLGGRAIGSVEVQSRFTDGIERLATGIVRSTIGMQVTDDLAASVGYAHQVSPVEGGRDGHENRFFGQLNWRLANGLGGTLSSRTRLEARAVNTGDDIGYRLRVQLRYQRPLRKAGPSFVASVEPFVALNTTDWGADAGLDQLRSAVGLSFPLTKALTFEPGYLHRYTRRSGRPDRHDHIVQTSLALRF